MSSVLMYKLKGDVHKKKKKRNSLVFGWSKVTLLFLVVRAFNHAVVQVLCGRRGGGEGSQSLTGGLCSSEGLNLLSQYLNSL